MHQLPAVAAAAIRMSQQLFMCMDAASCAQTGKVLASYLVWQANLLTRAVPEQVYTEGDSFTGAYHEAKDAIRFVLELQLELLKARWPSGLSDCPLCMHLHQADATAKAVDAPVFAGLRVRAAVHSGIPAAIEVTFSRHLQTNCTFRHD